MRLATQFDADSTLNQGNRGHCKQALTLGTIRVTYNLTLTRSI